MWVRGGFLRNILQCKLDDTARPEWGSQASAVPAKNPIGNESEDCPGRRLPGEENEERMDKGVQAPRSLLEFCLVAI